MKSYKVNQHTNRFGLKTSTMVSVWQIATITLFAVIVSMKLQPEVISPLPDNPVIEIVQAAEVTPKTDVVGAIKRIAGRNAGTLLRIAKCESGLKENAISKTNDWGVFQIHLPVHKNRVPGLTLEDKKRWLLNGENNVSFGYMLFLESGTRPWSASRRCWGA